MNLIKKFTDWLSSFSKISEVSDLKQKIGEYCDVINEKDEEISKLKFELDNINTKKKEDELAEYWNNKWVKSPILYTARNNQQYDVRSFIAYPSQIFVNLRKEIGIIPNDDYDGIVLKVLMWIKKKYNYRMDAGEYWEFPEDAFYKKEFDCEDGSNLFVSICRNLGIPADRIKVCCGWVLDPYHKGEMVGHSYPIYRRLLDDGWIICDWCYHPVNLLISEMPLGKENNNYGEIWWTYNDVFGWAQSSIEITGRMRNV